MAIIDILTYRGSDNMLIWKWVPREKRFGGREDQLRIGTQLVVGPSQVAVFVKQGQIAEIFAPGKYSLSTKNLPFLDKFVNFPFGGESPFKAALYYINKAVVMDTKFTIPPFNMLDQNFRVPMPVKCSGSFAVKAGEARKLMTRLMSAGTSLDNNALNHYFSGVIIEQVKSAVARFARERKLGPMELEGLVLEVSSAVKPMIQSTLDDYGVKLELFNMEAIAIIDEDPRVKRVIEEYQRLMALDMEERMRLRRRAENLDVYRVERSFDTSEKAAESLGTMGGDSGNIVGAIVGMGVAQPIANQMSNLMGGVINQAIPPVASDYHQSSQPQQKQEDKDVFSLLKELDGLRKAGVITEEEFAEKKQELLSKI